MPIRYRLSHAVHTGLRNLNQETSQEMKEKFVAQKLAEWLSTQRFRVEGSCKQGAGVLQPLAAVLITGDSVIVCVVPDHRGILEEIFKCL